MDKFDYVIVGAGSAGCVLANRLSEDPANTVLLLEAGKHEDHPFIRMPKGVVKVMSDPAFTWGYRTDAAPGTNNAPEAWARGKTLGGSSAVNGMMYVRGQKADFDELESLTSPDWSWDRIGEAYAALEAHELGTGPTRGAHGALHISMPPMRSALTDAAIEAGVSLGLEAVGDVNAPHADQRIGYAPQTILSATTSITTVRFGRWRIGFRKATAALCRLPRKMVCGA